MNKIVLITGATSGFGKAIAQKFAAAHYNCIITGRRKEKLLEVANELNQRFGVAILQLVFDVQDKKAVFEAIESLPEEWKAIDVLINNAGLALGRDSFQDASLDDWETMIDTNVKGLMYVSKAVVPLMTARKQGHIINLGSIAGKEAYKNGNMYCATKAAVDMLSKTMRIDLLPFHIKVTAIHPGAADTEFSMVRFKGDAEKAKQTYNGYTPLHAEDIAGIAFYCSELPPHVCINELVVTCTAQANATVFYQV
ncbi:SDR family NAD(P)-dependent oxidoreductase [Parasediminibacterium sp. JCM 36343]|uniref:SDR family NAD(P)-dependent oxidoreductase n=1 Tax=Parasediminibacterium sp. JCM 36343 TaxID=3374279 RepID=UPI003979B9F2